MCDLVCDNNYQQLRTTQDACFSFVKNEHYVPGSPIFREECATPTITTSSNLQQQQNTPSTPKSLAKDIGTGIKNTYHAMTVSITDAKSNASTVITTRTNTTPACYTSTRSAAMMALALGQRAPHSPAASKKKPTTITTTTTSTTPITSTTSPPSTLPSTSLNRTKTATIVGSTIPNNNTKKHINQNISTASSTTTGNNMMMQATKSLLAHNKPTHASATMPIGRSSSPQTLRQTGQVNGIAAASGTISGGSGSSGSDNDGFNASQSSTTTALRRLYFKSGRSAKTKGNAAIATATATTTTTTAATINNIPMSAVAYHSAVSGTTASGVPKVVIMGSSSASITDANINTSTDSASTLITNVTHTDTSETCDSLDLGDNSAQSEPLFSSLEEPLLTAIQIDSEHDGGGTEMELTSSSMYARPNVNLQDSIESQESCLSILTGEPTSTTPLLSTHRRHNNADANDRQRLPNTAPAPTSAMKHFTFDPPMSPKSARSSEKTRSHFTFKDASAHSQQAAQQHPLYYLDYHEQQQQQQKTNSRVADKDTWRDRDRDRHIEANVIEERRTNGSASRCGNHAIPQRNYYYGHNDDDGGVGGEYESTEFSESSRSKKMRSRETTTTTTANGVRNRYSNGAAMDGNVLRTSPKRERKRSPTSGNHSKVSSAPPTMKDSNFFGSTVKLSPTSQHISVTQRKYSSSSSSGGSERERDRDRHRTGSRDKTSFPFDREAVDYERIQRECFAVDENSSSTTATSDSDDAESCSVYERKLSTHHGSPKSGDIFQQYSLLTQQEQQQQQHYENGRPLSRKNSKRIRPDSVMHTTIREHQQFVPPTDAFHPHPQAKNSSSPGELNKFEDIANKFEQIPPKQNLGGSNLNLTLQQTSRTGSNNSINNGSSMMHCNNNASNGNSPTGSLRDRTPATSPSPMPDLRVDYFAEIKLHARKKSFKAYPHENLDDCQQGQQQQQRNIGSSSGMVAGPINVTPNPMEVAAVCTQPRATIVVQQPSLSLDNTVETLLIKNEGDFISVEQGKDLNTIARKRHSQQLQHPPPHQQQHHHQQQQQQQQQHNNLHAQQHSQQPQSQMHQQQQPQQQQQQQEQQQQQQQQQQQKRDDNMRQLLDVTNMLTFEELRDFEKRYGSPHHSRSQSVKTPGSRASGRPNQLCLPQQRSRVASMPNTGVEEEYYRLRHFSITGKGIVNRGDSLKSRRSRSNNSVASSNSSNEHLTATQIPAPNSARTSATCSLASSRESSTSNPGNGPYRVLMLGGPAVGKSSLVSQFMTSEYLHAYDTSIDDDSGEKAVSVLLSGEESELIFIDHPYMDMTPDDCLSNYDPHGYCVIYSASDRSSFTIAEHVLQVLWTNQNIAQKAVILVANKADLARSRLVSAEDGKAMATAYDCKFIETSVGINHNVDELLVGLLSQIRLKLENPEKSRDLFRKRSIRKSKRRACSPLGGACLTGGNTPVGPTNNVISEVNTPPGSAQSSPRKYRGSRTSASLKVKGLLGRVWARDSKSKSCENLHVL